MKQVADTLLALFIGAVFWFCVTVGIETAAAEPQPQPDTITLPRAAYDELQLRALDAERRVRRLEANNADFMSRNGGRGVGR